MAVLAIGLAAGYRMIHPGEAKTIPEEYGSFHCRAD